jgi:hypothetical protein
MKSEAIQNYILKNENNFQIAAAVGEAWPEARGKIVSEFLGRLDSHLKKKLKGWEIGPEDGRFFLDCYPGYYLKKVSWVYHFIGFQCGEYGDRMIIGVCRDTNDTREVPLHAPLLTAVQKIYPSAKSNSWWEASAPLRSPETDWKMPTTLWRMHKDATFLTDIANQLLDIAEVCEPILDSLVQKSRKSRKK